MARELIVSHHTVRRALELLEWCAPQETPCLALIGRTGGRENEGYLRRRMKPAPPTSSAVAAQVPGSGMGAVTLALSKGEP